MTYTFSSCLLTVLISTPIEILWRFIKYQWLPYETIDSQQELDEKLEQILRNFGKDYTIDFKLKHQDVSNIFA